MTAVQQEIQQLLHVRSRIQPGQADAFNVRNNADIISRGSGITATLTLSLGALRRCREWLEAPAS